MTTRLDHLSHTPSVGTKPSNPKDIVGSKKIPIHLVPDTLVAYAALAFLEGALKYGKANWRVVGVRASVYIDALQRHMMKFANGEWADPHTGVPHLASILACAGIMLDADAVGKLTDDRMPPAPLSQLMEGELVRTVQHLQEIFSGEGVHQYTIAERAPASSEVGRFVRDPYQEPE